MPVEVEKLAQIGNKSIERSFAHTFSVGKNVEERRQFHDRPPVDKNRIRVNVDLSDPNFHANLVGISRKLFVFRG
jgi:hypothetical protein